MRSFRLSILACMIAAPVAVPVVASAEEAASPLTFNVSVITDYRYRGISQTRLKPALQGGADYAFANGFYIGTWGSTIKWIKDNGVKGPVEVDLYGGYKGEIQKDFTYDVGLLQYWYVGNKLKDTGGGGVFKNANTTEVYGALTYGPITGKVSYALTNLFGNYDFANSRNTSGSIYYDLSGTFDLGSGFTLVPHVGYQHVEHINNASYTDYSVTVAKDLGHGFTLSLAGVGTNANKNFYVPGAAANSSKFMGKKAFVAAIKYAF